MMKQEQFAGMRARLMEQLQQGVEWSDEAILERRLKSALVARQ